MLLKAFLKAGSVVRAMLFLVMLLAKTAAALAAESVMTCSAKLSAPSFSCHATSFES
jgi:hypothetical protein